MALAGTLHDDLDTSRALTPRLQGLAHHHLRLCTLARGHPLLLELQGDLGLRGGLGRGRRRVEWRRLGRGSRCRRRALDRALQRQDDEQQEGRGRTRLTQLGSDPAQTRACGSGGSPAASALATLSSAPAMPGQQERRRRHGREGQEVERREGREDDDERRREREGQVPVAGWASLPRLPGPQEPDADRGIEAGDEDADEGDEPQHPAVDEGQEVLVVEDLVLGRVPRARPSAQPEVLRDELLGRLVVVECATGRCCPGRVLEQAAEGVEESRRRRS